MHSGATTKICRPTDSRNLRDFGSLATQGQIGGTHDPFGTAAPAFPVREDSFAPFIAHNSEYIFSIDKLLKLWYNNCTAGERIVHMHPVFGKCPICGEELTITHLECRGCGTDIGGHFSLGGLARLNSDDMQFIETFVKDRGNAYKVGEELGLPYSAVRSRLTEIIRSMGYEPGAEPKEEAVSVPPERRKAILDDVARGKITSEAAIKQLLGEQSS